MSGQEQSKTVRKPLQEALRPKKERKPSKGKRKRQEDCRWVLGTITMTKGVQTLPGHSDLLSTGWEGGRFAPQAAHAADFLSGSRSKHFASGTVR